MQDAVPARTIVFGTVVRNAPVTSGGELVTLDWDKKRILNRVPVYPENPRMDDDPNPRGNTRGCKGIAVIQDEIVAANFHTLKIFDHDLNHKVDVSHGLMVGLHEIHNPRNRELWIASTVIDAAVRYDLSTNSVAEVISPRNMPELQEALSLRPSSVDLEADNRRRFLNDDHLKSDSHLHLNAVTENNGRVYALFHRQGAICDLTNRELLIRSDKLRRSHNLVFVDDHTVITNDTFGRNVRIYDLDNRVEIKCIDLMQFEWVQTHKRRAERFNLRFKLLRNLRLSNDSISRPIFVRGLARESDLIYVGISPAAILCINWRTGELVDAFKYSSDPRSCIHGLAILK